MSPEEHSAGRPIRTVTATGAAKVLFDEGRDLLVQCRNDRGAFEVLCTADRSRAFLAQAMQSADLALTGFWRRRSGFKPNGERHFIWTLVVLSWTAVACPREASAA